MLILAIVFLAGVVLLALLRLYGLDVAVERPLIVSTCLLLGAVWIAPIRWYAIAFYAGEWVGLAIGVAIGKFQSNRRRKKRAKEHQAAVTESTPNV